MTQISRTQAWCKLAVLIADGMPAPRAIDFHPDGRILSVTVDSEVAFHAVAAALGSREDRRRVYETGDTALAIHNGADRWYGYSLNITAYIERGDAEPLITEDLSRVREVAEHGEPAELVHYWIPGKQNTFCGVDPHGEDTHVTDRGGSATCGACRGAADEPLPDDTESCRAYGRPHPVHAGHVYECCGKVGRISRHESWCAVQKAYEARVGLGAGAVSE